MGWASGLGLVTTPTKTGINDRSSMRAKKNGWLTLKVGLEREMETLVAAAASAPSSVTSKLVLCWTLDTCSGVSEMPDRFGLANSSPKPACGVRIDHIHASKTAWDLRCS